MAERLWYSPSGSEFVSRERLLTHGFRILVCALALAAVAAGGDPLVENQAFDGAKVTIRFQFWGGPDDLALFTEIAEAFVKAHPGIRVRLSILPWGQYWAKLQTQAAGGIAPDVIRLYSGAAGEWFDRGALLDLGPYAKRDGLDLGAYFPVALEACRWQGRLFSLPSDLPIRILIYNKDLFDRAGLSGEYPDPVKPMTWKRLVELGRKLTIRRGGRVVQFGLALGPQADVILIHQAGGRLVNRPVDPTRATADTPEVVAGLRFYFDLQYTYRIAPDVSAQQEMGFGGGEAPLLSGRVALGFAGPWKLAEYGRSGMRLGLAPLFRGKERAQISTPNSNGVYSGSAHPEEAWAFCRFIASRAGQEIVARHGGGVPALRSVAASPAFTRPRFGFRNFQAFAADLEYAEPFVMFPTKSMVDALDRVTGDLRREPEVTPTVAAARLQRLITKAIDGLKRKPVPFNSRVTFPLLIALAMAAVLAWVVWSARRMARTRRLDGGSASSLAAYLFLAPWLFGLIIFNLGPILAAVVLSFCDWDMIRAPEWVGMANYVDLFTDDKTFLAALKVTGLYVLFSVPIVVLGGLATAMLLNRPWRLARPMRSLVYLPSLFSGVAITLLWKVMYNPRVGVINYFIELGGGQGPNWLDDKGWVLPALVLMNILWVGGNMVIFHAALQGVPQSLYDAARVDGAGAWARFRHVTLPAITPAILFTTIIGVITSCQAFTQAFMLRSQRSDVGGPNDASMLYVLYIYKKAFMQYRMGYASALAVILFFLIFALTWLQLRASRRWVYYETDS